MSESFLSTNLPETRVYADIRTSYLSLICVMGQGSTADKRVLIDYNVSILHEALIQMFKL